MTEQNVKPNYYSILTADVRYDNELKANEKLLYSEITALSNKNGYCWAKNKYFADLFDVTKVTVSRWIKNLKDKGYVDSEVKRNKNKEIIKRKITPINKNVNRSLQNNQEGINKNVKGNSTRTNNTSILEERMSKINELHNKIFTSQLTPHQLDNLKTYIEDGIDPKQIIYAYELAGENDADYFQYIDKILLNWLKEDITSLNKAKKLVKKNKNNNSRQKVADF